MTLRDLIDDVPGLADVAARMELLSGPGRRALYDLPWLDDPDAMERAQADAAQMLGRDTAGAERALTLVRDITGTISRLGAGQTLDDIELFEVKALALACGQLRRWLEAEGVTAVQMPALEPVAELLDPEGTRLPHFYVYDAYDPRLRELRKRPDAFDQATEVEDEVRRRLSAQLRQWAEPLARALAGAAKTDILIAKAKLARVLGLSRPQTGDETSYEGLFNPAVREQLRKAGAHYQAIDVAVARGCTVITGANMAGKSLTLKTLALAQAMAQLGFGVPARAARVAPVERVMVSMGDGQDERQGLSSFAAEMLRADRMLRQSSAPSLLLFDEPARTTNPAEGAALVDALCARLAGSPSRCVVTTHYGNLHAPCRRLRVRGFTTPPGAARLAPAEVGRHVDYSLAPDDGAEPPREALRIARLIGVDPALLDEAQKLLR